MNKRRINVRAIIWNNSKILAVKHRTKDGGEAPYWAVPGGGLDPSESLIEGVQREILEETNVKAVVGKLLFIQQFLSTRNGYDEELEFFYHIENVEDFFAINLTETTHGEEELARIEFVDPKEVYILPAFLSSVSIAEYITTSKPVYLHNVLK